MKHRIKSILIISLVAAFLGLWAFRFSAVNKGIDLPTVKYYRQGDTVEYGNDFFNRDDEKRDGYEITVVSASLTAYDEYIGKYNNGIDCISEDAIRPTFIYDVEVLVKNKNTEDNPYKGIDLINTRLVTVNDSMQVNDALFAVLYPNLSGQSGFSLKPESEMELHLLFATYAENETEQKILSKDWQLLISMYPTKKLISLQN